MAAAHTVTFAMRGAAALALAVVPATVAAAPIRTQGCQGEGCFDTGIWVAERDLPLFAAAGSVRRIGTIAKGTRVVALGGVILTSRAGIAETTVEADHLPADPPGKALVRLPKGARVRTLYYEGEGVMIAVAPGGQRVGIERSALRTIRPYTARDWVRLRLPNGRTGWARRDHFACSGHFDDRPICANLKPDVRR